MLKCVLLQKNVQLCFQHFDYLWPQELNCKYLNHVWHWWDCCCVRHYLATCQRFCSFRKQNKDKVVLQVSPLYCLCCLCRISKQFQGPRSGRQVHWQGVHPQMRLWLHQVRKQKHNPTSKNNKNKIGFACKLVWPPLCETSQEWWSGDFVIKKFVNYSQECSKLWVQQPHHQQQESKVLMLKAAWKRLWDVKNRQKTGRQHWRKWN